MRSRSIIKAENQFLNEQINYRLQSVINKPDAEVPAAENEASDAVIDEEIVSRIVTTEEELEGYYIVKSIAREIVDADRIGHRDTIRYMSIILDGSNRKPICRLYFNSTRKYLRLLNEERVYERVDIESIDDIYDYADRLKTTARSYDSTESTEYNHDNEGQVSEEE